MADQVPFEEVEWNNSGAPESGWEVKEQGNAPYEPGEEVHVYIVFAPGTSIEEGIALIEREVLESGTLDVSRRDTAGNAVAAIMTYEQQQKTKELSQIISAEISAAAELHDGAEGAKEPAAIHPGEPGTKDTASRTKQDTEKLESVTEETAGKQNETHNAAAYLGRGMIIIAAVLVFLWMAYRRRSGKR